MVRVMVKRSFAWRVLVCLSTVAVVVGQVMLPLQYAWGVVLEWDADGIQAVGGGAKDG